MARDALFTTYEAGLILSRAHRGWRNSAAAQPDPFSITHLDLFSNLTPFSFAAFFIMSSDVDSLGGEHDSCQTSQQGACTNTLGLDKGEP
jgi:hypothetical protein